VARARPPRGRAPDLAAISPTVTRGFRQATRTPSSWSISAGQTLRERAQGALLARGNKGPRRDGLPVRTANAARTRRARADLYNLPFSS
jgi:hypothetical protein